MATTYTLIDKTTLGSTANYIEFTSIPSTYTDIVLVASLRTNRAALNDEATLQLNSTSISGKRLYGDGSSAASDSTPNMLPPAANATSNTFGNFAIYIPNYASTTAYKSISIDAVMENNATGSYSTLIAGLYSANTAVSSVKITSVNGSFIANSSVYLYGIKNS